MDYVIELIVYGISLIVTIVFVYRWASKLNSAWPKERMKTEKIVFNALPVISLVIIMVTLLFFASYDVVSSVFYISFYVFLGFTWIYFSLGVMFFLFDISWIDDALNMDNEAALATIAGGYIGTTVIYAGANIGDGPGWWCVIFAGGMGLVCWVVTAYLVNLPTKVFERISVGRDIPCGIRFGGFLLASGIILSRASAGDWTSFAATVVEFRDGWPVVVLALIAIVVERYYMNKGKELNEKGAALSLAIAYVLVAIACVTFLPPLPENTIYGAVLGLF
jgi:hypothetical protein